VQDLEGPNHRSGGFRRGQAGSLAPFRRRTDATLTVGLYSWCDNGTALWRRHRQSISL